MPFFLWLLFSFFMFPRLIHADVCAVHSSEICIVFHCVTMPQLIRPFFCPRAFGFFQVFFFFFLCSFGNSAENILDIYVSWSLSIRLPTEYIPCSGVTGSNCFSERLDPFMFHSLEFLLHSIPSLSSEVFSHFPAASLTLVISAGDHGALLSFPDWVHDPFKAPVNVWDVSLYPYDPSWAQERKRQVRDRLGVLGSMWPSEFLDHFGEWRPVDTFVSSVLTRSTLEPWSNWRRLINFPPYLLPDSLSCFSSEHYLPPSTFSSTLCQYFSRCGLSASYMRISWDAC